ncbi:MAG: MoaD family protein [Candidatus Korarchaeota archaeon]|nr:MoaD family protein [Candidatus Korarchaeota archaeon]
MRVQVRLFASFREAAGRSQLDMELRDGSKVKDLVRELEGLIPDIVARLEEGRVVVAVNGRFARPDDSLRDGDLVAVFPPVSGGGPKVGRFDALPSVDGLLSEVSPESGEAGAVVVFVGVVRGHSPEGRVRRLEYEAYEEMALGEMELIRAEALQTRGVRDVVIYHALGVREPGDPVMLVAVAAEHRKEAFETIARVVNAVKSRVPIWKKEITEKGGRWVEEGTPWG